MASTHNAASIVPAARARLNPAAGTMLAALWVEATGQLPVIIHHLAVDAVSWWILLEDLNIAWSLHRAGASSTGWPARCRDQAMLRSSNRIHHDTASTASWR
ncbi:hypothetical protein MAHJHV60_45860 [Mycobacterium avium subsp. hominissuis]